MKRTIGSKLRLSSLWFAASALAASCLVKPAIGEDIRIEKCDRLPVIQLMAAGQQKRFLLDTAATSILNLGSFSSQSSREISITSWRGTVGTSAREVEINELVVASHRLRNLRLPAIDLSPISQACGKRIDGIFGADMIEATGITVDLKRQVASVPGNEESEELQISEVKRDLDGCVAAFNRADAGAFGACLDPHIALFTTKGEFYGREQVLEYFRERYFNVTPAPSLEVSSRAFHLVGDAAWYDYDFTIKLPHEMVQARGMAMCRKIDGHWRLVNMHHSAPVLVATSGSGK
jgi:SnoaL-like domain